MDRSQGNIDHNQDEYGCNDVAKNPESKLILNKLRESLPETADYIELLFEVLAPLENSAFYRKHPEQVANVVDDIDEIAEELLAVFKKEIGEISVADKSKILSSLKELQDAISVTEVSKYFLRFIFEECGIFEEKELDRDDTENDVMDLSSEELGAFKVLLKYRIQNINLSRRDLDALYRQLGFSEITEQGHGSHTKWIDGINQAKGFFLSCGSSKIWLKNVLKDLVLKNISIDRIERACKKCNFLFEKKK